MSGFGYNVLGFGGGGGPPPLEVDEDFNRVSFLSHFDGTNNGVNNVIDDGSASNHTMTAQGVALIGQGSFSPFSRPDGEWGVAFPRDGGNDNNISVASSADSTFGTGDFTVELFAFFTVAPGSNGYANVVDFRIGSYTNHIDLYFGNNSKRLKFFAGGSDVFTSSTDLPIGEWVHLALVRASGTTVLYQNGDSVGSASDSNNYAQGRFIFGSRYTDQYGMTGAISNARVVKGTAVYTSSFTPTTSPLTAITNTVFLSAQSNRFVDNSASAHTMLTLNSPSVSAFGPFLTDAVYDPAVNGASAFFTTGTNTSLTTPDSSDFDLGATFTIEAWVYANTAPEYSNICGRWYDGSSGKAASHYVFQLSPISGVPQLAFGNPGTINDAYGSAFPTGEWVHVAVTQDGSTKRLFQNGIMGTTYSNPTTVGSSGSKPFSVGGYDASNAQDGSGYASVWDGFMCDLRVLKGTALYTSNFTSPTAPLTAITNTKLLLNMADGQAIDSAAQNNLVLIGDAKLSTGQAKFGDTSLYINGSDTAAQIKTSNFRFGTGDFTIEFWYYGTTVEDAPLLDMRLSANNEARVSIFFTNNNGNVGYFATNSTRITSNTTVATNTWTHIALVRSSAVTRFYFNGTQDNQTYSDTIDFLSSPLTIGLKFNLDSNNNVGYYDDVRISNMARYTANFTAPNKQLPDQGEI